MLQTKPCFIANIKFVLYRAGNSIENDYDIIYDVSIQLFSIDYIESVNSSNFLTNITNYQSFEFVDLFKKLLTNFPFRD